MDEQAKKAALRMIPYGLFALGVGEGDSATVSTVNWVTQVSFSPPLIVVGVKKDSTGFSTLQATRKFAISVYESGQKDMAFSFFRHVEPVEGKFGDYPYEPGTTGAPILTDAPAWWECEVTDIVDRGDHAVVVGEVIEAGLRRDADVLTLKECGVNYGG